MRHCTFAFLNILLSIYFVKADGENDTFIINLCSESREKLSNLIDTGQFYLRDTLRIGKLAKKTLHFKVSSNELHCPSGYTSLQWTPNYSTIGDGNLITSLTLYQQGYLLYNKDIVMDTSQHCLLDYTEDSYRFKVCNVTCSAQTPCIPKCCYPHHILDVSEWKINCRPSEGVLWKPFLYNDYKDKLSINESTDVQPFVKYNYPTNWASKNCTPILMLRYNTEIKEGILFRVQTNGTVWYRVNKREWDFVNGSYCIDGTRNFSANSSYYTGSEKELALVSCLVPLNRELHNRHGVITAVYGVVLLICSFVLLFTFLIYILQMEKYAVNTWIQIFYIGNLFAAYVLLSIAHFSSFFFTKGRRRSLACRLIAISSHFTFLSCFSWLSVISFDCWRTFWELRPTINKTDGRKKLIFYCLFAECVPCGIVTASVAVDLLYEHDVDSDVITPNYGKENCYMEVKYAQALYFYIPVTVFLCMNILFFFLTMYSLYQIKKTTNFATANSSKAVQDNQSELLVYSKLFVLMGVPWIFEVVSWASTSDYRNVPWYLILTDIIVICQVFAIARIFVANRKTFRALEKKYPKFKKFMGIFCNTDSSETTGTSNKNFFGCPCSLWDSAEEQASTDTRGTIQMANVYGSTECSNNTVLSTIDSTSSSKPEKED